SPALLTCPQSPTPTLFPYTTLFRSNEDRQVTRLGEGVFRTGLLTPEAIADTVKVLRRFHRAVQQEGTDTVRVVATSALRDARNSDRKSTRLNSSHGSISYAVFCLKK